MVLFLVTHKHNAKHCPTSKSSPDPEAVKKVTNANRAKKAGVKIVSSYGAYTEHTLFFVVETESYGALYEFFQPLMQIGDTELTPVTTPVKA